MSDARIHELRCDCGSLMARVTVQGIELKCRRCKRVLVVATEHARQGWTAVTPKEEAGMRR